MYVINHYTVLLDYCHINPRCHGKDPHNIRPCVWVKQHKSTLLYNIYHSRHSLFTTCYSLAPLSLLNALQLLFDVEQSYDTMNVYGINYYVTTFPTG